MRSKVIKLLLKKELLDVFRDRKAIIMLVLVPLLIYPLIFFGAFAVMTMIQSNMEQGEYTVLVDVEDEGRLEEQIVLYNEKKSGDIKKDSSEESSTEVSSSEVETSAEENEETDGNEVGGSGTDGTETDSKEKVSDQLTVKKLDEILAEGEYTLSGDDEKSRQELVDKLLQNEKVDVYVTSEVGEDGRLTYTTKYVSSITDSDYAETIVKEVLDDMTDKQIEESLEAEGLDAEKVTHPFKIKRDNIASTEQSAGSLLGMILPFMLIVSLLMGTMYPAIDTTAGEKERGTLETLLTLPVKNHEIIIAKFLTVALMGIASALLNMLSMGLMVLYMLKLVQSQYAADMGFDLKNFHVGSFVPAMLVTVLAVFAFSLFISAVTMCITALAKSYKEANNYITPLTLVVMLTAYIGFIPNIELTKNMALVPVANICLMIKNLLLFKAEMSTVAIVLISNILYAILAILFLSRIYDSEGILFDEGRSGVQLFQRRSNMKKGGVPTSGDAWFIVCFVMIIYLYIGSLLQVQYGFAGVFYSQMIILALPLIFVIYTKRSIRETYKFKDFKLTSLLGGLCLFVGTFLVENTITTFLYTLFPEAFGSVNDGLTETLMGYNLPLTLLVVALTPAICEEMIFRGFIQSGLRSRYKAATTIVLVAVIFGAYHTSFVRFIPTAILGACFAFIVYYSDSIYISMIMHFLNNAVAVISMKYPGKLEQMFPVLFAEEQNAVSTVIIAAIGIVLVYAGAKIIRIMKIGKIDEGK